jgi:glycine/D-amino acid oxidase-like deaminating enzyme
MNPNTVSFWHETVDLTQPRPALAGPVDVDVAIIGGGFCGLSTALYLKRAQPGLRVAVLEQRVCGYGASGRNGGFAMTLFGLTMEILKLRFGATAVREAQDFMEAAVDHVGTLVREEGVECDYHHGGLLTVATSKGGARRLQNETRLANRLGIAGIHYLSAEETRRRVNSATYLGARVEDNCATLNPAKLSRELLRLAEAAGAEIYEETPVTAVRVGPPGGPVLLRTPRGRVRARKLLFATNAYGIQFPQLRAKQVPVGTYIVLTEPLTPAQLGPIGWANREGIEDSPNFVHYYRLTADNRLLMGGGDVTVPTGTDLPPDHAPGIFRHLEEHLKLTFPSLRDATITHRWGGPVSVTVDMAPAFGWLGRDDRRVAYALGCVGHGVAMMSYSGHLLRDLLLERKTALTDLFFVNRTTIPWPPEPLRMVAGAAIHGYMYLEDGATRRQVAQNAGGAGSGQVVGAPVS